MTSVPASHAFRPLMGIAHGHGGQIEGEKLLP